MLRTKIIISGIVANIVLTACGGGGSSSYDSSVDSGIQYGNDNTVTNDMQVTPSSLSTQKYEGYVSSPSTVIGLQYSCGGKIGFTDNLGKFTCDSLPVVFSAAGIELGQVGTIPWDGLVYVQDILGIDRDATCDSDTIMTVRYLMSLDTDAKHTNGIVIPENLMIIKNKKLNQISISDLTSFLNGYSIALVSEEVATHALNEDQCNVDVVDEVYLPDENGNSLVAEAGDDKVIVLGNMVAITGSASNADNDSMTYAWQEDGKAISDQLSFEYLPKSLGEHQLTLIVSDGTYAVSDSLVVTVKVETDNLPALPST